MNVEYGRLKGFYEVKQYNHYLVLAITRRNLKGKAYNKTLGFAFIAIDKKTGKFAVGTNGASDLKIFQKELMKALEKESERAKGGIFQFGDVLVSLGIIDNDISPKPIEPTEEDRKGMDSAYRLFIENESLLTLDKSKPLTIN